MNTSGMLLHNLPYWWTQNINYIYTFNTWTDCRCKFVFDMLDLLVSVCITNFAVSADGGI